MKRKTTSPRLKRILCYEAIIFILMFACIVSFIILSETYDLYTFIMSPITLCLVLAMNLCFIMGCLFLFLYYKELKRITNKSIEYYNRLIPHYAYDVLILCLGFYLGIAVFSILSKNNLELSILVSISVAIFSLIFVLFLFILPTYKKYLSNSRKILTNKYLKVKSDSNFLQLKSFQGKIYKNNMAFNHLSLSMIIATFTFIFTLIILFIFSNALISYFLLFTSIFFNLVFIGRLAFLIARNYTSDLKELESMIERHNQKLEKKLSIKENKDYISKG